MASIIGSLRKRIYDTTGMKLSERQDALPNLSSWDDYKNFFDHNLVEVKFKRRIKKDDTYKKTRSMLATSNFWMGKALALSMGKPLKVPKIKRKKSWYKQRKLFLIFDLIHINYRMINIDPPNFKIIDWMPFDKNISVIGSWQTKYNIRSLTKSQTRKLDNR